MELACCYYLLMFHWVVCFPLWWVVFFPLWWEVVLVEDLQCFLDTTMAAGVCAVRSLKAFSISWTQWWKHECAMLKLGEEGMKSEEESPNSIGLKISIEIRTKNLLPRSVKLGKYNRKSWSREKFLVAFIFLCTFYSLLPYVERVLMSYAMKKMLGAQFFKEL